MISRMWGTTASSSRNVEQGQRGGKTNIHLASTNQQMLYHYHAQRRQCWNTFLCHRGCRWPPQPLGGKPASFALHYRVLCRTVALVRPNSEMTYRMLLCLLLLLPMSQPIPIMYFHRDTTAGRFVDVLQWFDCTSTSASILNGTTNSNLSFSVSTNTKSDASNHTTHRLTRKKEIVFRLVVNAVDEPIFDGLVVVACSLDMVAVAIRDFFRHRWRRCAGRVRFSFGRDGMAAAVACAAALCCRWTIQRRNPFWSHNGCLTCHEKFYPGLPILKRHGS
jgi:hypothetical protein